MEVASSGVPNGTSTPETAALVDSGAVIQYLTELLQVTLGAQRSELESAGSLLSESRYNETLQRCTRFASEAQVALYVQKDIVIAEEANGETEDQDETAVQYVYNLSSDISSAPTTVSSVAIIKRPVPIDMSLPIASQVQVMNLPGPASLSNTTAQQGNSMSPYQILHLMIHHGLSPYFESYTRSQETAVGTKSKTDTEAKTGIPGTKKKFADLELGLMHLQQNVEIPALNLPLHEVVQAALKEAEARGIKPSVELIPSTVLESSAFTNSIQNVVNGWIRSIQTITKMSRDPDSESASPEVNFWLSLEAALEAIDAQLQSEGVRLTMDILRHAKRYQPTLSFAADTGLKEATELVQKYNQLMRDFPLDELLSATSLQKVQESLNLIFTHLNKKLKICPYPIKRALSLVEAISGDLDKKIHELITGRAILHLDYREFRSLMKTTQAIWRTWDENLKEFTNVARESTRRRNEKFIPIKINARHDKTRERVKYVDTFRINHEQLQKTIINVLGPNSSSSTENGAGVDAEGAVIVEEIGDVDAVEEVAHAYAALKNVDVLDVSPEGSFNWEQAEIAYSERTSRVENSIIARLRDRLATARNANEMFRVFSKFNALLVRPKIRGAIGEYQTQLIDNVKRDISALHERFKQQYGNSEAHAMAQLRDLPPVSGAIIWTRQIEHQLNGYMRKVENVLGENWHLHAEGQKLQNEGNLFRKKLDTRPVFESWLWDVQRRHFTIAGRLFNVVRNRSAGNVLELAVNFDAQIIALFKEVRNLIWLNFQVPHAVSNISKEAKRVYPYAISLMESVRTLLQTSRAIVSMTGVNMLLNGYMNDAQIMVAKGIPLRWESFVHSYELHVKQSALANGAMEASLPGRSESKHVQFVREFAVSASTLQTKTTVLDTINENIQKSIHELKTCPYDASAFKQRLDSIQVAVDKLNLENYVNLGYWVAELNGSIETILRDRLLRAVREWIITFQGTNNENSTISHQQLSAAETDALNYKIQFPELFHEILMKNQVLHLDPPLQFARASWFSHFDSWLGVICNLEKIKPSRYQISIVVQNVRLSEVCFSDLPQNCTNELSQVYNVVESRLSDVSEYVDKWLQFQSLWDLRSEQVYEILGDDLSQWLQLLQEIRKSRATFDTSEVSRGFGNIRIDYEQVQTKVNAKYDQWQHEILVKFGSKLGSRIREVHSEIAAARKDLEGQTLEASSTAHAVSFITIVQQCKRKTRVWEPEVDLFRQGQTTLARQRYQFPYDWLHVENVDGEWAALNELLSRKSKIVNEQTEGLRAKISAEDHVIAGKIAEVIGQWNDEKPVSGTIPPEEASRTLSSFQSRLESLQSEFEMVSKAKEALDLPPSSQSSLPPILEEVQDFMSVWAALATIWNSLNDLRDGLWTSVQPRKLRQSLDNLIKMTKEMPSRMRQYAAFEHIQNVLRQLLKVNSLLSDMKSEAVKERHWHKIYKSLKPDKRFSLVSLTLGDVWDLQLASSDLIIRAIIAQAQGEMALEEFLKSVRETWQNYSLDLVHYQNKCRLIKGFDDLFAKCSENLNSLQAMRHSPYYKEFEEEATSWEDKLNRVHVLFDVWIDVQRQWVYLEGVFTGNADIKHLLPLESGRFQNINSEFFTVMKKVYKSPFVLDILAIVDVQKSLERLADLLNKIQKALGEYLERERVSFPRFYFVGDEDLLEIIGNSNDIFRVAKHFKKMFAGMSGLVMDDDNNIVAFTSKEGEEVRLKKEVNLLKTPRINDWLSALETSMKLTLAELLGEAVEQFGVLYHSSDVDRTAFNDFLSNYPAQIVVLASQVTWTNAVQLSLEEGGATLPALHASEVRILELLAATVLGELDPITRKKCEHMITEFVHQRDCISKLISLNATTPTHYHWLLQMRYVFQNSGDFLERLYVHMANAKLAYGFEYLGVPERLVRTPLTDRCFLTLTQALCQRLGGSPYGPAGTGKTESVKALGLQLGRFTLVFCCDDTFDFQAMGRIFLGICQVGAWGCFDEFNRLEERILSAVSQQIQNIQIGLKTSGDGDKSQIELVGRRLAVNSNTGIFITMNPGYAGRSNLPDNLKKLFRSVAMSKPDKELIAEVMLFSQGFKQAKPLSKQTVPFFDHCASRLSKQAHYDFGLRALKSVLVSSGGLKRARLANTDGDLGPEELIEPQIIVQSLRETIAPKLIREDVEIMLEIQVEDFAGVDYVPANFEKLTQAIRDIATKEQHLVDSEMWITKALQLYQIQCIHHGVMMVGKSGAGKSAAWKILLQAMQRVEGVEGVSHIIDSKVMSKESLYGNLDSTTREWTDGLFTGILRKIVDNLRGEDSKRHWIVFDGDVDPEWVENLNSVLDDNKLLTLPNGERLNLPPNVRIMFEVESLKYATLATVSRCGMVWFNADTVTPTMMISNYVESLRTKTFEDLDEDSAPAGTATIRTQDAQDTVATILKQFLEVDDLVLKALEEAKKYNHIMEFTDIRALNTLFSLLNKACRNVLEYNAQHPDFPLDPEQIESYMSKKLLLTLVWSLTGDCPLSDRKAFGKYITGMSTIDLPPDGDSSLIDYDVILPKSDWTSWHSQVPTIDINTHSVTQTDVIIPTVDTVRHEDVLYSWLAEHKPLLLCGPPGSGKTMTLFAALRKLPNMEVVGLNFSSATTPDLLIKTFEQYCEYKKTLNGVVMSPNQIGRWLVIFCDEINLPAPDRYGTQRAISFLRQLVEQNGFWRTTDKTWVTLDRIQFVGACNPPTDAGRTPMAERFLRHAPLIMVDYPGEISLNQIYGTFNSAVLKILPLLRGYSEALTRAMVQFYLESQARFTPQIQPHYVYSPRELTRWVRGLYEAIKPLETLSVEGLVRIWAHEALRLFQDRLVDEDERAWTADAVRRIALEHFPTIDDQEALKGPILFSNWLSKNYVPVEQESLREFVKARLRTFCEEEVDVPLVLFNDVLEHALRIDRVFRQPQGHLILIGVSGSGKTTLSRFVAWMNGLKVFQIKVHGKYSSEDFDDDLRSVLRRAGCKGEKICFIMDEANVLDSGFLERMNTLLANAEVPGLFEGDEFSSLMTACKEGAQRQGLLLDSQEELYKWFTSQIVKNLHVVFTMNPPEEGLSSKAATSPALFNRCVLNWMGDWSDQALFQVGSELTQSVDLDKPNFVSPDSIPVAYRELALPASHRDTVVNSMVYIHHSLHRFNGRLQKQQGRATFLTPRHYLDFVAQYVKLFNEKREDLEEQQRHLNIGLEKLHDTVDKVSDLRASLAQKKTQLEKKDTEANEKLQRMVADQQEAEQRKHVSLEVQAALEIQEKEVATRKEVVLHDLARAEPAVLEAQKSVSNIKRQHLTEVRSMGNPPASVRLALEAVCTLLGHTVDSWKTIQGLIRRDDFIASIVNYDNERQMTRRHRTKMQNEFLSKEDFTYERVNRASKACGPLVQWVEAQVNYSAILDRVGPLRDEVDQLEEQALQTKAEAQAIENTINSLESSIATYKAEYAALISETQAIKTEMSRVQFKVDRSVRLLDSLSSERGRWEDGSKSFETQIGTLVGDVLIAAAFLAYAGLYDQQFRKAMAEDWVHQLGASGIQYKPHNPITEYLSNADERLTWQSHSLPVDDLCTENAIILKRFNRYPLIVDPSGRITEFLQKESKERKLTVTSFLDDSFVKQLESALRFGNPILIQDAEHLDPILNHVLNKEYQKTGGRVLIQLGKQEIDFSPSFKLFLSTRDPSASFPPDICSRTTFVNFTVTQSSLQTQSLNDVLKFERPDVDERRNNLVKMQGEFKVHLRQLEKRLLQALNESRGNILDDDNVIETLETLKKEAADISLKMDETEGVMLEVDHVTQNYSIIARSCSAVFAVLEQLHHINHFYQFSLQYFVDIFNSVLYQNKRLAQEKDHAARVQIIVRDLFINTYKRTSLGLVQKDRITLAILLAQATPFPMDRTILDRVLDDTVEDTDLSTSVDARDQVMTKLANMSLFKDHLSNVTQEQWDRFFGEELAENVVPVMWDESVPQLDQLLRSLLLVKICRMDRFVPTAERFIEAVFGRELFEGGADLKDVVDQVTATRPIALSSSPGFDASYKVDALVEATRATCANIAMGSNEGLESADKAISNAAAVGNWVLVKNVHLAPAWLQSLEKRLDSLKPHKEFRLFLSMESSPKIPVNLIRASRVLMYEQPAGVRANMKDSLSSLNVRASKAPVEKARVYLLLCFLHAVVQERLRYAPSLGWKGFWEFNDSDYECSAYIIDHWVDSVSQGRSNVAPQKIPWEMIRTLVAEMYGGKIDDAGDYQQLENLVNSFLTPAAFEDGYKLVSGVENDNLLTLPETTSMRDFVTWVNNLPEREPPTYLGLPANAEKLLLVGHGRKMISDLSRVTTLLDEGEQLVVDN
ncbi:Dynein heavy chain, domain-2 [Penicillium expansum]|uniref:Dynein heavy chain, cytoplasmic n=1 Tax=Penicillium expansum TaxID=27334 RepID=A0A0A2K847_PENEN|nr:Dynein heavy chain, domain-2 [Penicillium expansum]KGO60550.1 Dynein heavy chain, domain-2 [Penicillium expansum]